MDLVGLCAVEGDGMGRDQVVPPSASVPVLSEPDHPHFPG
jgi:hypothetical protein